jgi:acetyl-CoA carboxylase carboxyltransferase component
MKLHNLELGADLMSSIPNPSPATLQRLQHYTNDKVTYDQRSKKAQEEAREKDRESEVVEKRAQMYDFGEGLLEIGVVMSSMFFISRNWMFPIVGGIAALAGTVLGVIGYLR